jgi:hypothetical protein
MIEYKAEMYSGCGDKLFKSGTVKLMGNEVGGSKPTLRVEKQVDADEEQICSNRGLFAVAKEASIFLMLPCLILFNSGTAKAEQSDGKERLNHAVLVELFTSEGCSSCPPADQVLSRLQTQPVPGVEIVTLSEHVPYWNYLGWKDPYSQEVFSKRQQSYASRFKKASVYTPQMVIDGKTELLGSNYLQALADIKASTKTAKARIQLSGRAQPPDQLSFQGQIQLPNSRTHSTQATVYAAVVEDNLISSVIRGENAGSKLVHNSVVRELFKIGELNGVKPFLFQKTVKVAESLKMKDIRLVLFVQASGAEILGAASTRIH